MLDSLYVFSAVLGGSVFVLRTVLMLLGVGGDGGDHVDADVPSDAHGHADSGTRLVSIQGVSSFLMIFGLVGLVLTREAGVDPRLSVALALAAGLAAMWAVARVFTLMLRLQASGTLDLEQAVGQEGVVYLTVKPGAGGQVQIALQGRLGVYEARVDGAAEIPTGRSVVVVGVRANSLVVEALPGA